MNPVQTPPAPVTPAPAAPNAPTLVSPPSAPALSAIEQAARAAISQMEQQPPVTPAAPAPPVAPVAPATQPTHHSHLQPRTEEGQFNGPPQNGQEGVQPPAGATIPPVAGAEQPPTDPNAPAGQETDEPGTEPLLVQLPPRRPGEPPIEIAAPDQETAEAMRRMANGYARAEQVRAEREEVLRERAEVMEAMEAIESDPVALLEQMDPEVQRSIALYLLTRPEVWNGLQDRITNFDDPRELQLAQAQAEAERLRNRTFLQQQAEARREARSNAAEIRTAVASMLPDDIDDIRAQALYADFLNDVRTHAQRNNLRLVSVEDLPAILAARCRLHGINPIEAADRMALALQGQRTPRTRGVQSRAATPAQGQPPARPSVTRVPPRSGQQFVQSDAQRRAVAAVAPAGAGSPGAGAIAPPAGQSIEDRIAWAKQNLAGALRPR